MRPRVRGPALVALGAALMGCASRPPQGAPDSAEALRGTALEATIDGNARLRLEVEAWRSWQPVRPTPTGEGDPLIAVLRLVSSAPIPAGLTVETVHLLHGTDAWSGPGVEESPREAGGASLEVVVRNGPTWAAGDSIDVVVRVKLPSGQLTMVRAPRTAIERVD